MQLDVFHNNIVGTIRPQAVIVRMQANVFRSNQAGRLNTFSSCVRLRRKKRGVRTYGDCAVREVMRHIVGTIKRIPQQLRRYARP